MTLQSGSHVKLLPNSFYIGASEIPVETKSDGIFTSQNSQGKEEEKQEVEGMTIIS